MLEHFRGDLDLLGANADAELVQQINVARVSVAKRMIAHVQEHPVVLGTAPVHGYGLGQELVEVVAVGHVLVVIFEQALAGIVENELVFLGVGSYTAAESAAKPRRVDAH